MAGTRIETVGIRDLKANLSRHLKRVQGGVRLAVTERGRTVATLEPVEAESGATWAHEMVASGRAHWSGGKPAGAPRPARLRRAAASAAVLAGRR